MRPRSRPTIVDVARLAGVSPTTVSYVLSGPQAQTARISEATRERVRSAVVEIGYVPNHSARSLRLQRASRVLFLGSRFSSLYAQSIAQALEVELARHELALGIQVGSTAAHIARAITTLDQNLADGLIIETDDDHLDLLRDAAGRGHAIVALGPSAPEPTLDVISNDDGPAVRRAMDHLVDRGFERYVLMARHSHAPWEPRIAVACDQLRQRDVAPDHIEIVTCPHDRVRAHDAAIDFLSTTPVRTAVYGGSDVSAIGVLWAAMRLGRSVPDDVGIVGHGNSPETTITHPAITSIGPIDRDYAQIASLMTSRLECPSQVGRHLADPFAFLIRASS